MQSFEITGLGLFSVLFFISNGEERAIEIHVYTLICLHMFV